MLQEVILKVYHSDAGVVVPFEFSFNRPAYINIDYEFCGRDGDHNYKRYGLISGSYVVDYYVFKLSGLNEPPVYLLFEENFWSREEEEHEFVITYKNTEITIRVVLNEHTHLYVFDNEEELDNYLKWLDELY